MIKETDVCIVGAGPAGMVLALLLAQKGVRVLVLESQKDFEREYRGEVLMPRFTQAMKKVGLFDTVMQEPHLKLQSLEMYFKDWRVIAIQFAQVCPDIPYAIWMPQPILLNALYKKAKSYPSFELIFGAAVRELTRNGDKITGVAAQTHTEKLEVRAKITVGADGRFSMVRKSGDFKLRYEKYDFDIIWFTVTSPKEFDNTVRAFFSPRHNYLILPKYPDAIQCGLIAPKGGFTTMRNKGLEAMRQELLSAHSVIHPFARALNDFHPFSVLQARIEMVDEWARNGCLLIGDAAHCCSPAGAIGVAVAVETAVAAAEVIGEAIERRDHSAAALSKVQERREKEVIEIHKIQNGVTNVLASKIPGLQYVMIGLLFIMDRLGLFVRLQRRLMVGGAHC